MSRRDVIVEKLADIMDPENAQALVDEVEQEAFIDGFDAAHSDPSMTLEQALEDWDWTPDE